MWRICFFPADHDIRLLAVRKEKVEPGNILLAPCAWTCTEAKRTELKRTKCDGLGNVWSEVLSIFT